MSIDKLILKESVEKQSTPHFLRTFAAWRRNVRLQLLPEKLRIGRSAMVYQRKFAGIGACKPASCLLLLLLLLLFPFIAPQSAQNITPTWLPAEVPKRHVLGVAVKSKFLNRYNFICRLWRARGSGPWLLPGEGGPAPGSSRRHSRGSLGDGLCPWPLKKITLLPHVAN